MVVKITWFLILLGVAWSQTEITIPDNFTLPPELKGKVSIDQLKGLQNQTMPQLKKKCDENGGPNAFQDAMKAYGDFSECLNKLVNVTTLQEEINDAKPTGQVDEVFKKYCEKTPQFKSCVQNLMKGTKPCLTEKERVNLNTVNNVTEQVADFVCYKEGDRIALFIAEGGQECFSNKQEQLQECTKKTFGSDVDVDPNNVTVAPELTIPELTFGEKECRQLSDLQSCVVHVLESCDTPTTGNIVDSMFKFIRKATPCSDKMLENKPGSASGLTVTSATIVLAVVTYFFI